MQKTKIQIQVAEHIISGCLLINNKWCMEYTDEELLNGASTDYESNANIVDDEEYDEMNPEHDRDEDYQIITKEVDGYDNYDIKDMAFSIFIDRASALGYGNIEEVLEENYRHGSYLEDHGRCSMQIINSFDPETDILGLADEEIEHLCDCMNIANDRHINTDYDNMLKDGISKDLARQLIA